MKALFRSALGHVALAAQLCVVTMPWPAALLLSTSAAFIATPRCFADAATSQASGALRRSDKPIRITLRSVTLSTRELRPGSFDKTRAFSASWNMLNLRGDNLGQTGVSVALGAWAMAELSSGQTIGGKGDLAYGRVAWRNKARTIHLRAGRLGIFAGAPRYVFMDGVAATVALPANFSAQAYYGTAIQERLFELIQSPILGARLAWSRWRMGQLGVAYQDESSGGETARRTVGMDFSLRLFEPVRFTGLWAQDLIDGGLQRARLDATWHVFKALDVFANAEVRDPLAWLPKYSIFSAFVARTDKQVGAGFDLRTPGALQILGRYDRYLNDGAADGYGAQAEVRLRLDKQRRHVVGLIGGRTFNGDNGYWHARLFARSRPTPRLTLSLDLDGYRFLRAINGYDASILAALAMRWQVLSGLHITIDGRVWRNPYFEQQAMGMVQLRITEAAFRHGVARQKPVKSGQKLLFRDRVFGIAGPTAASSSAISATKPAGDAP